MERPAVVAGEVPEEPIGDWSDGLRWALLLGTRAPGGRHPKLDAASLVDEIPAA